MQGHRQAGGGPERACVCGAGAVELVADAITVLNTVTRKLPFLVSAGEGADEAPREELRLRHRVLDLRRDAAHTPAVTAPSELAPPRKTEV